MTCGPITHPSHSIWINVPTPHFLNLLAMSRSGRHLWILHPFPTLPLKSIGWASDRSQTKVAREGVVAVTARQEAATTFSTKRDGYARLLARSTFATLVFLVDASSALQMRVSFSALPLRSMIHCSDRQHHD